MADTIDINIGDTGGGVAADVPRDVTVPLQTIADGISAMAALNKQLGRAAAGGLGPGGLRPGVPAGAPGRVTAAAAAAGGGVLGFFKRLGLGAVKAVGGGITGSFLQELTQSTDILSRIMLADRLGVPRQGVIAGMPLRSRFLTQEAFQAQQPKFFMKAREGIGLLQKGLTSSLDAAEKVIRDLLEESPGTAAFIRGIVNPSGVEGLGFLEKLKLFAARTFLKGTAPLPPNVLFPEQTFEKIERERGAGERQRAIERGREPVPGPGFEMSPSQLRDEEINQPRSSSLGEPLSSSRTQDHYADWMSQPALEVAPVILPTHWPSVELYIT